jgi:hypothetical protein
VALNKNTLRGLYNDKLFLESRWLRDM